jgi:hypothetical protein
MSRVGTGDTVYVKPTNNIYTALAAAAVVINILGLIFMFLRAASIFNPGGLLGN